MDAVELRPLSLGEILDRTFTMYRRHFLFFVTLAGIFQIPSLAFSLLEAQNAGAASLSFGRILFTLAGYCVAIVCYVLASGGAVLAISEFYLGHTVTISDAVRRILHRFWSLMGAAFLVYMAFIGGLLLLIVPGFYVACRLLVTGSAVVVDKKGAVAAFSRSWELTQGFAGRAFLIVALYFAIAIAISSVSTIPLLILIAQAAGDPERLRTLLSIQAVIGSVANILISPILYIGSAIFYYDLRVRKEAFDLHFMMNPNAPADAPQFLNEA